MTRQRRQFDNWLHKGKLDEFVSYHWYVDDGYYGYCWQCDDMFEEREVFWFTQSGKTMCWKCASLRWMDNIWQLIPACVIRHPLVLAGTPILYSSAAADAHAL
jgi:hypothetical protein